MYALILGMAAASLIVAPCLVALLPASRNEMDMEMEAEAGTFV